VREFCTLGSVRGVRGNAYPYRDPESLSRALLSKVAVTDTFLREERPKG